MSSSRKATARRYFEDVLSTHRLETADEILTDDVIVTAPGSSVQGVPELKAMLSEVGAAFPHRDVIIESQIEEGDQLACVFRLVLEHVGEYQGLPPTGKTVDITGVDIFTFSGDRISEIQVYYNAMAIMEQLGVIEGAGTS